MKALATCFFDTGCIALKDCTKHMFNPLTSQVIVLVCTMVHHAIKEYEGVNGREHTIKFEGAFVDRKSNQSRVRKGTQ